MPTNYDEFKKSPPGHLASVISVRERYSAEDVEEFLSRTTFLENFSMVTADKSPASFLAGKERRPVVSDGTVPP